MWLSGARMLPSLSLRNSRRFPLCPLSRLLLGPLLLLLSSLPSNKVEGEREEKEGEDVVEEGSGSFKNEDEPVRAFCDERKNKESTQLATAHQNKEKLRN